MMIVYNTLLLFVFDLYIFFALRSSGLALARKKWFPWVWWGYSALLATGVFISYKFSIPLAYRSVILVAFFITVVCKLIYVIILLIDDIRRGGVWLARLFTKRPVSRAATNTNPQLNPALGEEHNVDEQHSVDNQQRKEDREVLAEEQKQSISRSDFLLKSGIAVASIPFFPLTWGVVSGAYDYRIRRQKLYLPNLPKAFHGMKLGQLSDVHSGSFYNKKAVLGGVEMLLGEKPDVVFFTGDLVNNEASEMRGYQDIFSKVKAELGVYSVLGNHDYGDYKFGFEDSAEKRRNFQYLVDTHKAMGWDLLRDENRQIRMGNESISIVGVENWGMGRFPKKGDLGKALRGTEEDAVKLLMSHDPSHWRAQVLDSDVDAMFAGHTHGMQFGVRGEHFQWSPAQYIYPEWAGLYQEGNKQLYVNAGFGFLGYPGRVGILPEITIFELLRG